MRFKENLTIQNWTARFVHYVYIPIWLASYFIPLYISSLTVPNYTMATDYISNYGYPQGNPEAWVIWAIGHLLNGLLMIPMVYYASLHPSEIFDLTQPKFGSIFKSGRNSLYISAMGWIFMFIFPQYPGFFWDVMHGLNAVFLLGGYYLGLICWGFLLLKAKQVSQTGKTFAILIGWFAPAGFIISQIIRIILGIPFDAPERELLWCFTIPTWEWALMICSFVAFIEMLFLIRDKK